MKKKTAGFTILELLVTISIIAILSTIFLWNMVGTLRNSELRDATNQVAADFQRARAMSQKNSISSVISWPTSTFSTYTITQNSNTIAASVPNGVTVNCTTGCDTSRTFTYSAPYGELQGITGAVFTVTSPAAGIIPMEIRVVGVTGKVIVARQGS